NEIPAPALAIVSRTAVSHGTASSTRVLPEAIGMLLRYLSQLPRRSGCGRGSHRFRRPKWSVSLHRAVGEEARRTGRRCSSTTCLHYGGRDIQAETAGL